MSTDTTTPMDVSPAAEILQAISPPVLATLLAFREREQKKQAEIASEVGCARSTISKYVQTLTNLPVAVLDKDGHRVTVTSAGHTLIDLYRTALAECSIDIETVNWSTERDAIEEALSPLYRFRSTSPYLILDGIYELDQQTVDDDHIWEDDLLMEIDSREPTTIDSISSQHFDQVLEQFDTHDVIDRDDDSLSLTKKGRTLGTLCRQIQVTFGQTTPEQPSSTASNESTNTQGIEIGHHPAESPQGLEQPSPSASTPKFQSTTTTQSLGAPDSANAFRGGLTDRAAGATPRLGPVICVRKDGDVHPVGPVKGDTVAAVATQLRSLAAELEELDETGDGTLQAGVLRSLVRGDQVTPLGEDWQDLSEASFTEWQMINKALELVSNES